MFNYLKNTLKLNGATILVVILTFVIGFQLGHRDYSLSWKDYHPNIIVKNQQPPTNVNLDFKLFWEVWNLVGQKYIDKAAIDPQKMYYGAIQGMVAAIGDPYTVFLPPSAQQSTKEALGGSFEGVGMELGFNKDKRLVVIAPLAGTPAEKAGIQSGDQILKIDGKDATNLSLPEAVDLIRGPKGTTVNLSVYRDGESKPRDLAVTRDTIIVKSVELSTKQTKSGKNIAIIKLSRFGEKTNAEWDEAISQILKNNPAGIILDLRNNPGGFLDGAVYIDSEFLDGGNVVLQEDGSGNRQPYPVMRNGKLLNIPLVVLINKGSASASEIVAGALQDRKRATLIGEQSFGKGTIQTSEELSGGTGIHITTAKWLTPSGRWIHNIGLSPDIKIASGDDPSKDPQLDKSLDIIDSK